MNKRQFQKKLVILALKHSSFCRKKYYDLFFRKEKKNTEILYLKKNTLTDVLNRVQLKKFENGRFAHQIDDSFIQFYARSVIDNIPPNYELVINNSLQELLEQNQGNGQVEQQNREVLNAVMVYIDRIISVLKKDGTEDIRIVLFENMKNKKAETLEDALQRILLWSSIFWQTGHRLVGLGRLDKLLDGIKDERSYEEIVDVFVDFINELHRYYEYKSSELLGDIGQIIILGGLEPDGRYFCNRYSYYILYAIKKAFVTDPKILLRVSKSMPRELLEAAVDCLAGASGSPLFSNDDVIIPKLQEFGYEKVDAHNYVTSACWEPVSYGNSLEQNNLDNVKYANAFVDTMKDSAVKTCNSFEMFISLYEKHLKNETDRALIELSAYEWELDPLFTLFTDGCKQKDLDISQGGAKYNNYGLLSVGMANTVDSLLNIKRNVFDNGTISLEELHTIWKENKTDLISAISQETKKMPKSFGHDTQEAIALTNRIMMYTIDNIKDYRNAFNGKVKIGLSSPGYISTSKSTGLTYDGRMPGTPLSTHISCEEGVAYTELVSFASQLNYTGLGTNGNVIDYFVSPDFIKNNSDKFVQFIKLSIKQGFYQMQMNVLSSQTLIDAKENPEQYKGLIVRVWGFSAYFIDLPKEYQDLLIERALRSEGKIAS